MDTTAVNNVVFDAAFTKAIVAIGGIVLTLIIVLIINRDKKEK